MIFFTSFTRYVFLNYLAPFLVHLSLFAHKCRHYWQGPSYSIEKSRPDPPECLSNPKYGETKTKPLNDLLIHYAEKGDPSSRPMLCLHAFPGFWFSWRHQLEEFGKDYRVVAPNLADFFHPLTHLHDKYDKKFSLFDQLADDLAEFLDSIDMKDCVVLGEGLGCQAGWFLAKKYPHLVNRLYSINSSHPLVMARQLRSNPFQMLFTWCSLFYSLPGMPLWALKMGDLRLFDYICKGDDGKLSVTEEELEAFKYYYGGGSGVDPWESHMAYSQNFFQSLIAAVKEGEAYEKEHPWAELQIPGIIIRAEGYWGMSQAMCLECRQFVKRVIVMCCSRTNHIPQQQRPEELNYLVQDFVNYPMPSESDEEEVYEHKVEGNYEEVQKLLKEHPELFERNKWGNCPDSDEEEEEEKVKVEEEKMKVEEGKVNLEEGDKKEKEAVEST